jgi:hypothetical protein
MIERRLEDTAIKQQLWAEATDEVLIGSVDIREQIDFYGTALRRAVARDEMDVDGLRDMVNDLTAQNREAFAVSSGNLENLTDADYFEAVARSIALGATNSALANVRSSHAREKHYWSTKGRPSRFMPGMSFAEAKDRINLS